MQHNSSKLLRTVDLLRFYLLRLIFGGNWSWFGGDWTQVSCFHHPSSSTSLFWTTRLWPCILKPLFLDLGLLFSISHLCQHLHFPSHQNQSCSCAQIRCRGCKVAIFTKAAGTDMAHMVHMVHIWHISTYGTKVHMAHTVHIVHIEHMAHIWHKEQLSLITTMITPHEWR